MLTFEFPFQGECSSILSSNILNLPTPTINQNYSTELKETIYSMLIKDPNQRIELNSLLSKPFFQKSLSNSKTKHSHNNSSSPMLKITSLEKLF
jgi:serine/threonine protein kinase